MRIGNKKRRIVCWVAALAVTFAALLAVLPAVIGDRRKEYRAPTPVLVAAKGSGDAMQDVRGDFYVSPEGDDAGAVYAGRSWIWYGNVIRYNCIYDLGSSGHRPDGIYLDDALSGQEVYGNLLVNIPKNAVHIGGGRDNVVRNNIIVNAGQNAVYFDDRAREGALHNGWFSHAKLGSGDMWEALYSSPWQSALWQDAFPQYRNCTDDVSQSGTAAFFPNPASAVTGNLIFDKNARLGDVAEEAYTFGNVSGNALFSLDRIGDIFADAAQGSYSIADLQSVQNAAPEFESVPLEEIGRK